MRNQKFFSSDRPLNGPGPEIFKSISAGLPNIKFGVDQTQIKAITVNNYWAVWSKNNSRVCYMTEPSALESENVGWFQQILIPIVSGIVVMNNTPNGIPAEMHYFPNALSQNVGERKFLFVANEIDLGRKSTVVEFVNSTRLAIAGMYGLLVENKEEVALSLFDFPYTLDYSLDNILRRIRQMSVRDAARSLRIKSLIDTHQPSKALAQIENLSTRQGTVYTDSLIDELKAELADQNKRLQSSYEHKLQLFK